MGADFPPYPFGAAVHGAVMGFHEFMLERMWDHANAAEEALEASKKANLTGSAYLVQVAQAHATLALVFATAKEG